MEEVIQYWKKELNCFNYTKDLDLAQDNYFGQFEKQINMISRTLNELERLQKENTKLQEEIMENDLKVIGAEEYTKASMGEIIEHYYTANEDCILKQVIRDEIEKLKQQTSTINDKAISKKYSHTQFARECCIGMLKELLGE